MIDYNDQGQDNTWPLRMIQKGGVLERPAAPAAPPAPQEPAMHAPEKPAIDAALEGIAPIGHGGALALMRPASGTVLNYERVIDVFIPGSVPKVPADVPMRPMDFVDAYELKQEFRKQYEGAASKPGADDGLHKDAMLEEGAAADARKENKDARTQPTPGLKSVPQGLGVLRPSDAVKEIMQQREIDDMGYLEDGLGVL